MLGTCNIEQYLQEQLCVGSSATLHTCLASRAVAFCRANCSWLSLGSSLQARSYASRACTGGRASAPSAVGGEMILEQRAAQHAVLFLVSLCSCAGQQRQQQQPTSENWSSPK